MAFERTRFSAVFLHFMFLCSFFSFLSAEVESDISCLKSIKDSLEDLYDSLLYTWDFKIQSKSEICTNFYGVTCSDDYQVLSIVLGTMRLQGQFPQGIANCSSLQTLNLSNNYLSGDIPFYIFSMLPSLYELDLSYNDFSGEIPASIGNFTGLNTLILNNNKLSGYIPSHIFSMLSSLIELDLSCNKYSGEIPASVGNLTGLSILLLNDNEFTGEIPCELGKLTLLTKFSVANNLLWGPVPVFHSYFDVGNKESYWNNSGLCGGPLEPCDLFHQSFREGLIAGYVFSATSVLVIYMSYFAPWTQLKKARRKKPEQVGAYYAFTTRKRKKAEQKEKKQIDKLHFDLPVKRYQSLLHLDLQEKQCQEITAGLTCKMSFIELCEATDFFSVEGAIGVGSIGITYKARLPNGWSVAVKRPYNSQLFKRQFDLEIMILRRYRHRNIVPLLGFCVERVEIERKERILVYKYMPNGSLSDWLSEENGDVTLNWPVRVRTALGIARGLCWLHHNLHVVHFSICSECILLDQNFEPKISNFGEARFIHHNIGDDPDMRFHIENWSNSEIGFEKMDVYNFGVVLLELLAGKRLNPMNDSFINNNDSGFHEAIDESLIGKGFDDEIFTLFTIARCCAQPFLDQRPTMLEVFNKMSNIWETHELGNDFEMSKQSEVASATTSIDEIVEIESL